MQGNNIPTIIPHEILQLKHIFGVNSALNNSLHMLTADKLLYVAGYYAVVYNPKQKDKSQSYYSGAEGYKSITSVCISSNKKQMAMGLRGESKPLIYYYQLNVSAKRKKVELGQNLGIKQWVSVAFATGNQIKYMASLSNKNNQSIIAFWSPDKNKCLAYTKISGHASEKDLNQLLFSPNTSSSQNQIISVLGQKTFRIFNIIERQDKTFLIQPKQKDYFTDLQHHSLFKSHIYLTATPQILILTQSGLLLVKIDQKGDISTNHLDLPIQGQCISNWSEGFLVGGANGIVIYRLQDGKYIRKQIIEIGDKQMIAKNISVLDDKVSILLNIGTILQTKIRVENKQIGKVVLEQVGVPFHNGAIVSMDVCIRKPLVATAGRDKCIKIWNYQQKTVQTTKNQTQAALCLSFHPSGLHLVIAYSDKLRMMNVQKDGQSLNGYKDINSFKNCSQIKFSNGGHYFAAVSGTSVHIFKFYTGQNPPGMTFSGHTGKIRCLAWSKEDNFLVTCGSDGIILGYRIGMQGLGSKLIYIHNSKQSRLKGIGYSCITVTNQNKIYAVGTIANTNERIFKQILLDGSQSKRELIQNNVGQISFSSTSRILVAGVDDKQKSSGAIKCYKFPLTQHIQQFPAHDERGVQKLRITYDDKYVVSAGRDGCLMIFEIRDKQAKGDRIKDVLNYSNQVLVVKSDLDTLKADIQNLKQQKHQLQNSNTSIPGGRDQTIKQLREKYQSDEQQWNQKYNAALQKKNLLRKKFQQQIKTKKQQFENSLQQYDSNQSKNVMQESAQYDALKRTQQIQNQRYEKQIQLNKQQYERQMKTLQQNYRKLIQTQKNSKRTHQKNIQLEKRKHIEVINQIRQEKQQQLKKLQNQHAQQVNNLTQATLRANSDVSITNKKISQKIQQKQRHIQKKNENQQQINRLNQANEILMKEIQQQAQIIQERDKTIGQNQRKIYELKKKSQQLQKFKYVLDHKIKQLKKDIGPRQQQIANMKVQTNKMDKRLKHFNSLNSGLAEFVSELFKNQQNLKAQIAKQRSRISFQNVKIKQFKDAVFQAVQYIQNEQKLKEQASQLNRKFVVHSVNQVKMDSQIEQEYKNQKKYLQKSVAMLKKNLQKDNQIHKQDNIRIMKQNVDLIKQINQLRYDTRQNGLKKSDQDDKKNKPDPKQEQLKELIKSRRVNNEAMRKQIKQLQQRLSELQE